MTSFAKTILITGANRGLGLEFVRQLAKTGPKVLIAGCRNPSEANDLQDFAKKNDFVKIVKLDVEKDEDIDAAVKETKTLVGNEGLNLLINNAGIFLEKPNGGGVRIQTRENLQRHFSVNSTSPIIVTQKFLPLLEQAASNDQSSTLSCSKAANVIVTSIMGSQSICHKDGINSSMHYRTSKSAANMATVLLANELKDSGILVFSLHPGWVRTDMGGSSAGLGPEESVKGLMNVLKGAGEKEMGFLVNFKGEVLPF